jgi:type IV secretory pathway VirB9-like protein
MRRPVLAGLLLFGLVPAQNGIAQPAAEAAKKVSGSYRVSGAAPIRPSLIWDDGEKTFLD